VDAAFERVLAQLDSVREDVVAHVGHHRHAPARLAHDELVHPLALLE